MKHFMLYSEEQNQGHSKIVFPTPINPLKNDKIREGMSPSEIANVMSDRLISFVDKAVEEKKFTQEHSR